MTQKVLVIGASGHLGGHLVGLLVSMGFEVRALVREGSRTEGLANLAVELVYGDVLNKPSIARAMEGCDAAFHLAAPTRLVSGLRKVIVQGTRNVLESAQTLKLSTVVYTSSAVTVGYTDEPDTILDESNWTTVPASPYHLAKFEAERMVLAFAKTATFRLVVVNPATIVGSLDFRITPSTQPIQQCLDKGLPFTFDSGLTIAPVRDVAMGHILAMRKARSGERYILGGDRVTIRNYFQLISECSGRPTKALHIPWAAMLGIGLCFTVLPELCTDSLCECGCVRSGLAVVVRW